MSRATLILLAQENDGYPSMKQQGKSSLPQNKIISKFRLFFLMTFKICPNTKYVMNAHPTKKVTCEQVILQFSIGHELINQHHVVFLRAVAN